MNTSDPPPSSAAPATDADASRLDRREVMGLLGAAAAAAALPGSAKARPSGASMAQATTAGAAPALVEPLVNSSVVALAAAIRRRELSSAELVDACLQRIEQANPALNAVVQLRAEDARAEARAADEALARGDDVGPLHGVPMTIKDSIDTAGVITTGGTKGRAEYVPTKNATVVDRLLQAGAILLGKTNTPEFTAYFETFNLVYGQTNNPWDLERTPGGSSGGAAAIIAAGGVPFDIGSDLVLHRFDNARQLLPALEWAINEVVDNVFLHAEAPVPGVVCAQFFPKRHRLDVAICDMGRGIKASISEGVKVWSHGDAVSTALQRGVTRNPEIGQGNGLAGTLEIARRNSGSLSLWTGDAMYRSERGENGEFDAIPSIPGTGLRLALDTSNPVDLRDTFIRQPAYTYLEFAAARAEESGILVRDECVSTGNRAPARALRRKILALIPDLEGPLVVSSE